MGFTGFDDPPGGIAKIIAGYHQFHAVRRAVASTVTANRSGGDRKAGVIWHTQGLGKSVLLAFYTGQLVGDPTRENLITNRNDLNNQRFTTLTMCRDRMRQPPIQAESGENLQWAMPRALGGVIFTTVQKCAPGRDEPYPMLPLVGVVAGKTHPRRSRSTMRWPTTRAQFKSWETIN